VARRHLVAFFTLLPVLVMATVVAPSHAQTAATGTILGSIVDPQGSGVPGAVVVVHNVDTGIERTTTTTAEGLYRVPNLPPGNYEIRVEAPGFSNAIVKEIHLYVGDARDVNFKLVLASISTQVTVTGTAPLVETTRTDVSSVVDDKLLAILPASNGGIGPSNDYLNLAVSVPGVRFDFSGNSADLIGPGAYNFRGNAYNVDGGNITDPLVSSRDALGASLNEVQEFQVLTNNYSAEYGQAGSIIINVITKSGTNEFHGDGHAYFRGRNLSASNFFYNLTPDAQFRRAPFQKQEWGATAGGPFVKDRTFWFASFEKTHQEVPITLFPDGGAGITLPQPINEILWSAKIDHELTRKNHLYARFFVQRQFLDNLGGGGNIDPESLLTAANHDHTLNLGLTSAFTPHAVNEARFFWHRNLFAMDPKSTQPGQFGANFFRGADPCCPQGGSQHRFQYLDNLTWTRGAHTLKTGFDISHFPYFTLFQQFHFGAYAGFPDPAPNPGLPTRFIIGVGPGKVSASDNIYGFYVQDSWRLKQNLTLNYGLRYDLEVGAFQGGTIRANVLGGCLQGNGLIPACSSDHNNFQPRIGIAWSPGFERGFLHWLFGGPDRSVIRIAAAEVTEMAFLNVVLDSRNFDGLNLLTITINDPTFIQTYYPNEPPPSAIAAFIPTNISFFGRVRPISNHLQNPETRHASITVTRQFSKDYVVELGYIGVLGFGQFGERDTNFPPVLPDSTHPGFFFLGSRPDPHFDAIRTNENSRTSAYHGFLAHLTKQLSHHMQLQASYTYSKTISSTEDFFGTSEPGDPRDIRAERALAQNDVRHVGSFGARLDTQKLFGTGLLKGIFGDWTIGILGQMQSGRPYPVSTGDGPFFSSTFGGVGAETQQRPNVLPDGTIISTNIASSSGTNLSVGPNGAAACGCPQTTFLAPASADPGGSIDSFTGDVVDFQSLNGNLGRDVALTDSYFRFDVSFAKSFQLVPKQDRFRLELRADFFNIFNHTNFQGFNGLDTLNLLAISADPDCRACLNAQTERYIGSDGRILHIQDLRHGRVSRDILNPVFGPPGNEGGLGDPTGTDVPRLIQLSVAIKW
jgi:carboxypeptidase family protein/TonB-dependent receptor-like protein